MSIDTLNKFRWRPTNAPAAGSRTDDIFFIDERVGWAVNSDGLIIKTDDGFETFEVQDDLDDYLRCCGFADASTGWVGTFSADARLYRTANGKTWTKVDNLPDTPPVAICGLSVPDKRTVYAAGTNRPWLNSGILKTTDAGNSWTFIDMNARAASLVDIDFTSPEEGWVVGGIDAVEHPGRRAERDDIVPGVFRTKDGGTTWTNVIEDMVTAGVFPRGEWGWKIQRLSESTLIVGLQNFRDGAILRTDDGGSSWRRIPINDRQRNANLEGIGFLNERRGWVGGWGDLGKVGGYSSKTVDGGKTWDDANEIGFRLNRFRFIGDPVRVAYASGDTVYKFSEEPVSQAAVEAQLSETEFEVMEEADAVAFDVNIVSGDQRLLVQVWDRFGELVYCPEPDAAPGPGTRRIEWKFKDRQGHDLPAGPYIVRITANGRSRSRLVYRPSRIGRGV